MTTHKVDVLIAGSGSDINRNLQGILEGEGWINIVGSADSQEKVLELAENLLPEVIVVDMGFAGDGLKASRQLLKISPDSKIIVLTICDGVGRVDVKTLKKTLSGEGREALADVAPDAKNTAEKRRLQ
jgi:PleD family two-component response regulator